MDNKHILLAFCFRFWLVWLASGNYVLADHDKNDRDYVSALGDPGMRSERVRVALEAWNFCNEVGKETPHMGSPRYADCADLICNTTSSGKCKVRQLVSNRCNGLHIGQPFPYLSFNNFDLNNPDLYAVTKEQFLAELCKVNDGTASWNFWNIMLKNGNFDTESGLCPKNGRKVKPFKLKNRFPCFGKGCMNQPLVYHEPTSIKKGTRDSLTGSFYGSYDVDAHFTKGRTQLAESSRRKSYFKITWKKGKSGSWEFHHLLKTSKKYPWLMLYLRADAIRGFSGGYRHQTRGMMKQLPVSPNFKARLTLDIKRGGGPNSQFYLLDIGSCWKNDGRPCDGDPTTDVTRYSEMIINPNTTNWCKPSAIQNCPPYHIKPDGTKIHRTDTKRFPYAAYHVYCAPGNAKYLEKPVDVCDNYSNPQPQEIVQILPHPEWAVHGYPAKKGEGWVGDKRTWNLDVGALSQRLHFYQDPGTKPAERVWTSVDVGTEIYVSEKNEVAEWTLSDFDVIVPQKQKQ